MKKWLWIVGVLFLLTGGSFFIDGEFLNGLLSLVVGGAIIFFWLKSKNKAVAKHEPEVRPIEVNRWGYANQDFFIAWSNKMAGFSAMVKDYSQQPHYKGMTADEIKSSLNGNDRAYKYGLKFYEDIYLEDEPTNKVNPGAIKVMSRQFGQLGYISDADLIEVRELLKDGFVPTVRVNGGDFKYLDIDGKLATEKTDIKGRLIMAKKI